MNPRVLITGAAGVVGSALAPRFAADYSACSFVDRVTPPGPAAKATPLTACDLESAVEVRALVDRIAPDVVVHLAGNKDVFALEGRPEVARRANVDTAARLAEALRGSGALIVYVSSDYVFEGTAGPYRETSPTGPRTEYGRSKVAAEELLRESGLPVAIARSSSLFGYPGDFVSLVKKTLVEGRPFVAFSDLISNPTATTDFYQMLRRIIDRRLTGTLHTSGAVALSRAAFATLIATELALDTRLISAQPRTEQVRPADLSLDNSATYAALGFFPRPLEESLHS